MGKQTRVRGRSNQRRGSARVQGRRPATSKQNNLMGLRLLLVGILLAMSVWALMRVPIHSLLVGSIAVLAVVLVFIVIWFVLRFRPTSEERQQREGQRIEARRMEETAQMVGVRPVEIQDLRHLGDKEFEYFTGALLEAMGVASELEVVGGAGDGGIDLRGRDRFNRLFIVQCKRLFGKKGKVTPEQTRSFRGARQRWRADEAWFVTTSSFTDQAEDEVRDLLSLNQMVLVDGKKLIEYIHEYWESLPAEWRWKLTECISASR